MDSQNRLNTTNRSTKCRNDQLDGKDFARIQSARASSHTNAKIPIKYPTCKKSTSKLYFSNKQQQGQDSTCLDTSGRTGDTRFNIPVDA